MKEAFFTYLTSDVIGMQQPLDGKKPIGFTVGLYIFEF